MIIYYLVYLKRNNIKIKEVITLFFNMNLPIGIFEEDIRPIQNQYPNIDLKEAIVLFLRRDN